jgi:hypothetical protein
MRLRADDVPTHRLGPLDDFRMQVAHREFVPTRQHTGGKAQGRHDMQQYDLGMKMATLKRGVMNHTQRYVRQVNREKNLIQ